MTITDLPRPTLTLIEVDPNKLRVNPANVRKKIAGLDELAASIALVGVQVPLIVRPDGDTWVVVAGERRALAAVKAGVPTVPVIVRSDLYDPETEQTVMMVENLHREGLTPAEEAKGYEQLAAFGVKIEEIAQLTGRDAKRVAMGLAVAQSPAAIAAAVKHPLSFDHLAVLAEFDGDKKAVEKLVKSAENDPRYFGHLVQELRRTADRKAKGKAERERLKAAGVAVISKAFGYDLQSKSGVLLSQLKNDANETITAAAHKKCPGHAASINYDGTAVYGCTDPAKYGHKAKPGYSTSSPATQRVDPAKEAAAKLQAEQDTDALDAATTVRLGFVREMLARKTAPDGALIFVVSMLAAHNLDPDPETVAELTGLKNPNADWSLKEVFAQLGKGANDARLQVLLLAFVCAAVESGGWNLQLLAPPTWRSTVGEAQYLQFLDVCGYGLSEIEQRIITVAFPEAKPKAAKRK